MNLFRNKENYRHKYNFKCLEYDILEDKYKDSLLLIQETKDSLEYYKLKCKKQREDLEKLKNKNSKN